MKIDDSKIIKFINNDLSRSEKKRSEGYKKSTPATTISV